MAMSTKKVPSGNPTEIRIGIADSTQELNISSDSSQEKILSEVTESLDKGVALVILDVKGRQFIVPHTKIAFVEVGESAERRVGFANR